MIFAVSHLKLKPLISFFNNLVLFEIPLKCVLPLTVKAFYIGLLSVADAGSSTAAVFFPYWLTSTLLYRTWLAYPLWVVVPVYADTNYILVSVCRTKLASNAVVLSNQFVCNFL